MRQQRLIGIVGGLGPLDLEDGEALQVRAVMEAIYGPWAERRRRDGRCWIRRVCWRRRRFGTLTTYDPNTQNRRRPRGAPAVRTERTA